MIHSILEKSLKILVHIQGDEVILGRLENLSNCKLHCCSLAVAVLISFSLQALGHVDGTEFEIATLVVEFGLDSRYYRVRTDSKILFSRTFQDLQRPNSRVFQDSQNSFSTTFQDKFGS